MNTVSTLTSEQIKNRVETTNSFTKDEIVLHRDAIRVARTEKRAKLAKLDGSAVGAIIGQLQKERNAVVTEMKTRTSARQQTWNIRLTAKVFKSEADLLRDKAAKLQKQLNAVEEKLEAATAQKV